MWGGFFIFIGECSRDFLDEQGSRLTLYNWFPCGHNRGIMANVDISGHRMDV